MWQPQYLPFVLSIEERNGTNDKDSDIMHKNLPSVVSFSDDKILKLDLVFGPEGWRNP